MALLVSYQRSGLTLEEALQIAYNDNLEVDKIFIEPLGGELTDQDSREPSGEEDGGGFADNLSKNQLSAEAEIVVCCKADAEDTIHQKDVDNVVSNEKNSTNTVNN